MKKFTDQEDIVSFAKKFADERLRPFASDYEKQESLPKELIHDMAQYGFLTASLPTKYGGLNLDSLYYGKFTEELGKACCNTRGLITVHNSLVSETILKWGSEEQKDNLLPLMSTGEKIGAFALTEPDIGTDARNVQCSYVKSDNSFIINGKKKWISFADIADFFIVIAAGDKGVSAFIVDSTSEGVTTKQIDGLLAGKASHIAEINFDNVEVPINNLLCKEGSGFSFIVNTALDNGRYSIAWAGVAIAQEALESMVNYSRRRNQFGKGIYSFQHVQGMIANATSNISAARALCLEAAILRDQQHNDATIKTTIAKYFSSKVAMEVAIDAVQVHGGNGCCSEYPVERLFREAKVLEIIEGTSQVLQGVISSYSLRKFFLK